MRSPASIPVEHFNCGGVGDHSCCERAGHLLPLAMASEGEGAKEPSIADEVREPDAGGDGSVYEDRGKDQAGTSKVAVAFGYLGAGFQGMQRNPGAETVEEALEAALRGAGLVEHASVGDFRKLEWTRAARTDKGVSAAGQVVGLRMTRYEGWEEAVNSRLPEGVQVYGAVEVARNFNAKNLCDRRRYEYVIPTFAFDPQAHRPSGMQDGLSLGPSEGSEFGPETRWRVERMLQKFVGTHNFHNFSARVKPTDASAQRYVIEFRCGEPFTREGIEFVSLRVLGQSFMLHQIRKMVGVTVAVMRGDLPERHIDKALTSKSTIAVPMAPEVGLFLSEPLFAAYNNRWGKHIEKLDVAARFGEPLERFKQERIYPYIAGIERHEGAFAHWLRSLNTSSYLPAETGPAQSSHRAPPLGRAMLASLYLYLYLSLSLLFLFSGFCSAVHLNLGILSCTAQ